MKRLFAFILALAMSISLCACGGSSNTSDKEQAVSGDNSGSSDADVVTVTDVFGRNITIPGEVNTAAALGSAARLMVYARATDKLIGVTETDMVPKAGRPYSYVAQEDFSKCVALAEGSDGADFAEAIVEADPDVIFYFDSDTAAMDNLASKTGLPVVGVYAETCFDETFYDSLALIGEIMGTDEQTDAVIQALKGWASDLDSRTKDVPDADKPTVYAGAVNWSGTHGIEGTFAQYAPFTSINARNVADETGENGYVEVDREQISAWDPDIIFLTISNMDIVNEDYSNNPAFYDSLSAVKNGKVYSQVNFNSYWCNLELAVLNAYYAGTILYPDSFSDVDFASKADEIFNIMLGTDYYDVMCENGMDFCQITIGE